jgi:hypothetical protein
LCAFSPIRYTPIRAVGAGREGLRRAAGNLVLDTPRAAAVNNFKMVFVPSPARHEGVCPYPSKPRSPLCK